MLVALDRWSSYTVAIVWELAWADSEVVVLDEWLSYTGGRISRFVYSHNDESGVVQVLEIKIFFAAQPWWEDFYRIL